jgi:hypothetical protein
VKDEEDFEAQFPDNDERQEESAATPTVEDLAREAKERFQRYLEDRSVFPQPMRKEAFHGLAGQVVNLMAEHCESSLESLLVQFLVVSGNLLGRSVYVYAGGPWLFPNEFTICVGMTSRGRKGTAWRMNENLFEFIAPDWNKDCTDSDVQSGEGIVQKIRDEVRGFEKRGRKKKTPCPDDEPEEIVLDPGVSDKRLLIIEEEFSYVLKMARRQGNTLTEVYRKSWDSPRALRNSNKNSRLIASDPHVSLIAHTNKDELLATIADIEFSNGFANRILWCATKRRTIMPDAEYLDWKNHQALIEKLNAVFKQYFANTSEPRRFKRTRAAHELWQQLYRKLNTQDHVTFIDGVLVRDTSHLLKLALIYAVLDQSREIDVAHLNAALAVCDYSQASARWLFCERTGNRLANNIFWALIRNPEGVSREWIVDNVCYRHIVRIQLEQALEALVKNNMVRMELRKAENGRKIEVWFANFAGFSLASPLE